MPRLPPNQRPARRQTAPHASATAWRRAIAGTRASATGSGAVEPVPSKGESTEAWRRTLSTTMRLSPRGRPPLLDRPCVATFFVLIETPFGGLALDVGSSQGFSNLRAIAQLVERPPVLLGESKARVIGVQSAREILDSQRDNQAQDRVT